LCKVASTNLSLECKLYFKLLYDNIIRVSFESIATVGGKCRDLVSLPPWARYLQMGCIRFGYCAWYIRFQPFVSWPLRQWAKRRLIKEVCVQLLVISRVLSIAPLASSSFSQWMSWWVRTLYIVIYLNLLCSILASSSAWS